MYGRPVYFTLSAIGHLASCLAIAYPSIITIPKKQFVISLVALASAVDRMVDGA